MAWVWFVERPFVEYVMRDAMNELTVGVSPHLFNYRYTKPLSLLKVQALLLNTTVLPRHHLPCPRPSHRHPLPRHLVRVLLAPQPHSSSPLSRLRQPRHAHARRGWEGGRMVVLNEVGLDPGTLLGRCM
jgi:hypothetical protein